MSDGVDARLGRSIVGEGTAWQWAVGLGLLAAFSPVILDLLAHLRDESWARASLIFPVLAWFACRADKTAAAPGDCREPSRLMWLWLVLGLVIELIAVAGGATRFGRVGLLIAVVGLLHSLRWMNFSVGVLLLWMLPVPKFLIEWFSPALETFWGHAGAFAIPGVSLDILGPLPFLTTGNARLPLVATDNGIALIYGLAGLGWYKAVSTTSRIQEAAKSSVRWALLLIPIQFSLIVIAGLALRWTGDPEWPSQFLAQAGWGIVLLMGCAMLLQDILRMKRRDGVGTFS